MKMKVIEEIILLKPATSEFLVEFSFSVVDFRPNIFRLQIYVRIVSDFLRT